MVQFPPNTFLLPLGGCFEWCSQSNQLCSVLEAWEGARWRVPPTTSSSPAPLSHFHPTGPIPPTLPSQLTLSSRFQSSGWPSLAPLRLLPERLRGRKYWLVNTRKGRQGERRARAGAAQPTLLGASPCTTPGCCQEGNRVMEAVRQDWEGILSTV